MIVWLNGPLNAGKTRTARELVSLIPGSTLYDPGVIGGLLRSLLPPQRLVEAVDYQDLPMWRRLVVDGAAALLAEVGGVLVVPMTLLRQEYRDEIFGGLAARRIPVRHVLLSPDETILRSRVPHHAEFPAASAANARNVHRAENAGNASPAENAGNASRAENTGAERNSADAGNARTAGNAGAARNAGAAGNAGTAGNAGIAGIAGAVGNAGADRYAPDHIARYREALPWLGADAYVLGTGALTPRQAAERIADAIRTGAAGCCDIVQTPEPRAETTAAGVLLFDEDDRVLLVDPTYKPGWEFPGGVVEPGEPPARAGMREVAEELGLELADVPRLLILDWEPPRAPGFGGLRLLFDGGLLPRDTADRLLLPCAELRGWRFVTEQEAELMLPPVRRTRLRWALRAREQGRPLNLEAGVPVG
ncbi:NUDIX hydrolase [Streptomyces varsoviensis]|uniref:NUDIX hydrolase n=1 Tax=Streptomyces varsoviensis TaxID=67373 RepID=UPI0033DC2167